MSSVWLIHDSDSPVLDATDLQLITNNQKHLYHTYITLLTVNRVSQRIEGIAFVGWRRYLKIKSLFVCVCVFFDIYLLVFALVVLTCLLKALLSISVCVTSLFPSQRLT